MKFLLLLCIFWKFFFPSEAAGAAIGRVRETRGGNVNVSDFVDHPKFEGMAR